jgi:inward rectifier potassium channel
MTEKEKDEKNEQLENSGFNSDPSLLSQRLLNKDGSYNIIKEGFSWEDRFTLFHFLINTSWTQFFGYAVLFYISINVLFAFLFMLVGVHQISGIDADTIYGQFFELFFFSATTLTTVGYGNIYPIGFGASIVAFFQAFVGLLSFAALSGLFYGKIAKPKIKIKFSEVAIIAPYRGIKGLMFRLTSGMNTNLGETTAKVVLSRIDSTGKRRFYNLELEMEKIFMFATSWTVVHPINDDSPILGMKEEEMKLQNVELMIHIKTFDETYAQEVLARHSYKFDEIIHNVKFVNIHHQDETGTAILDVENLSEFEVLDPE